jgi:hypothetical protein
MDFAILCAPNGEDLIVVVWLNHGEFVGTWQTLVLQLLSHFPYYRCGSSLMT